jgi:hypothetical protein
MGGARLAAPALRSGKNSIRWLRQSMFQKSGYHFSEENMLQTNKSGAKSDSTKSDFALSAR